MSDLGRFMLALFAGFCLFLMALGYGIGKAAFGQSGAHGDGHAQTHDIYKDWVVPNTAKSPCCNDKDCRPTRAYYDDAAGFWRAWNGSRWLFIPWDRVLPTDYARDGRSHLCASEQDTVYCFSPAEPKS